MSFCTESFLLSFGLLIFRCPLPSIFHVLLAVPLSFSLRVSTISYSPTCVCHTGYCSCFFCADNYYFQSPISIHVIFINISTFLSVLCRKSWSAFLIAQVLIQQSWSDVGLVLVFPWARIYFPLEINFSHSAYQ